MPHAGLTLTRRNAVLAAIGEVGLEPQDFEWSEEPSWVTEVGPGNEPFTVDVISHTPTGYFFKFEVDHSQASLWAIYSPGRDGMQRREHAGSWDYVVGYVQAWLEFVRQEHEAPDLWAELSRQRQALADHAVENTPFTPDEQAQIAAQLTEAKEYVRANPELEPRQLELIEAQLDYLVEASRRVGRIDWRNLLVGSLLSLVLQAAVPVGPLQHLLFIALRPTRLGDHVRWGSSAASGRGVDECSQGGRQLRSRLERAASRRWRH